MFFKKHKVISVLLCILSALIIFFVVNIIVSNCILTYNEYTVETEKIKGQTTFVAISDSEGRVFGENNSRLAEKVKNANPEFVMILGDMVDNDNGDYSGVVALCKTLAKDYPVYYSLGNHELSFSESQKGKYIENLKKAKIRTIYEEFFIFMFKMNYLKNLFKNYIIIVYHVNISF